MSLSATEFRVRIYGDGNAPTLIYLPGIHGDGTLITGFRHALNGAVRFVEVDYPRTTTLSIAGYACGIEEALKAAGVGNGWLLENPSARNLRGNCSSARKRRSRTCRSRASFWRAGL